MDRILIVDDEFLIRYTLEEGLKDRGYDAYSAATVEEGLEFVRKYHPGVLLLDNLLENSVGMDEIVNFKNADEELQVIDPRVTIESLGDIGIKACVDARVSYGGTAPSEVRRQIKEGTEWLESLSDWK